ncbi:NAD-dependent epimerase/dehydratase family protein [Jannaschia formosa]|uniref:NAD-dependent epimerase/dehydratase family protein n=1 Tax=Jannaschia formosa TaxID=2259592 RepID=UPI0014314F78|nr:NAD-dependent epimerase/dehydratase family protein [Jannaschia formosa]
MPPPRLALTGATGRVARLLRPFLPGAVWLSRGDDLAAVAGARALVALAGVTSGDAAALNANTACALAALDAAAAHAVPRVFLLSSAAVYGRAAPPLRAEAAPSPAAPYGEAKADMERAVAAWRAANPQGPEAICLRLGNVAGADALFGNLVPGAVPAIHAWPDGATPKRSYIGPRTLARVFTTLADAPAIPAILNVAAPGSVAMGALATAAGHDWTAAPAPPEALPEVRLDTAPLESLVAFPPEASTPEGLVAEWREARA